MIVAIIQARMGSQRLPGKALMDIEGKPMLQRVVERVCRANRVELVVVATTVLPQDDAIETLVNSMQAHVFRGHPTDVLDRYYHAAKAFCADPIIRIGTDCPLVDPKIINEMIVLFMAHKFDYMTNRPSYPDGFDVEIFTLAALERVYLEAKAEYDREHVTPHFQCGSFKVGNYEYEIDLSNIKLSVDEEKDLVLVREVYRNLGDSFSMEDILKYIVLEAAGER